MKGNMLGVAPGFVQDIQHALSASVVERMDDDYCVAMSVRVSGEPGGDGVSGALVIMLIREVVFFYQVVIEKNRRVVALFKPFDSLPHITRYIQNMRGELLPKPGAAHFVIFDKKNTPEGIYAH
jgi:hypothetical protein